MQIGPTPGSVSFRSGAKVVETGTGRLSHSTPRMTVQHPAKDCRRNAQPPGHPGGALPGISAESWIRRPYSLSQCGVGALRLPPRPVRGIGKWESPLLCNGFDPLWKKLFFQPDKRTLQRGPATTLRASACRCTAFLRCPPLPLRIDRTVGGEAVLRSSNCTCIKSNPGAAWRIGEKVYGNDKESDGWRVISPDRD